MSRRHAVIAIGLASLGSALGSFAQQKDRKLHRVGVLWHAGSATEEGKYLLALMQGFRDLGYEDGKNIAYEHRFPNEEYEKFNSQAAELARLKVDVLVAVTLPAALALQRTSTKIPIVFLLTPDPVGAKLVDSLSRPGGTITGFSNMASELNAKRLQFFKEVVPGLTRVALLVNPTTGPAAKRNVDEFQAAGASLKIVVQPVEVGRISDLEGAFATIARSNVQGVVTAADPLFYAARARIAELCLAHGLSSNSWNADVVPDGFLMSYGANIEAIFRRAPLYVDKILKGVHPSELPVELPSRLELVLNLRTAKALGLTIPQSILLRADRVIE